MRDAGGGGGEPFIAVDADAVDEAAARIDALVKSLDTQLKLLRDQAVAAYGAFPPSDLQHAYGYCWGRWSQALLDGMAALASAGTAAHYAAHEWRATESSLVREANEAASDIEGK